MSSPETIVQELLEKKGLEELWDVQKMAIEQGLLDNEDNFIIIAPTASGKTLTSEFAIHQCLKNGGRVAYLVPTNSLIHDKETEFQYLTEEYKVSGLGATLSDWGDSDVIISSFEPFYKSTLMNTEIIEGFNLAVIDEFHILYDRMRGFTLEKILTLLKLLKIRVLCLSATFEDKNEVSKWLEAKLIEIPQELRAVPLYHDIIHFTSNEEFFTDLKDKDLLPYIIFCNTKENSKNRALFFAENIAETYKSQRDLSEELSKLRNRSHLLTLEQDLVQCLSKRVAFHHSGLHSDIKKIIEKKFLDREVDYLFCTTGLAYGMNLPAKSVVLRDLRLFNQMSRKPEIIPVHLYLQMAGRAGRPQFGDKGFSFVIVRSSSEEVLVKKYFFKGAISKAISHINEDSLFRKAILELVYSGRNSPEEIITFFKNTYYDYQSSNLVSPFSEYDLMSLIKGHISFLERNDFITFGGVSGYNLSELGQVTLDFLFTTFYAYELEPFLHLDKYVSEVDELVPDFDLIHGLSILFSGTRISKLSRKKIDEIETFFEENGIEAVSHPEYSAYAFWYGWIENMPIEIMEERYNVNTSSIMRTAREIASLLVFTEKLAKIKQKPISSEFLDLIPRFRKGYKQEELPFYSLRRFGRVLIGKLTSYCNTVLSRDPWNCEGSMFEMLHQFKEQTTKDQFIMGLRSIDSYSEIRATRIYEFLEKHPVK